MTTLSALKRMKQDGTPIAVLTAYDAAFARLCGEAGCDVLLVGDSLGMVVQGHRSTLPVTLKQMVYHTEMVARGNTADCWLVVDIPFMADATVEQGLASAQALVQAGADMVKLEGGERVLPLVERLAALGVPVCGHLGLLPQSVLRHGYRNVTPAEALLAEARALEAAGAEMLVLECVPAETARQIAQAVAMPVIGIGSGPHVDGQVLVLHDVLGISERAPSFSRNFMAEAGDIPAALAAYVEAVRTGEFPDEDS